MRKRVMFKIEGKEVDGQDILADEIKESLEPHIAELCASDYVVGSLQVTDAAEGDGWRPIESAPRDGRSILVIQNAVIYKVAWLNNSVARRAYSLFQWCVPESWQDEQGGYWEVNNPTHWQALPTLPVAQPGEAKRDGS